MTDPHFHSTRLFRRWTALVLLLGWMVLPACGTIPDPPRKLETKNVTLMYIDQKTDPELEGMRLSHPQEIEENLIAAHLRSIRYRSQTLVGSVNHAFTPEQVEALQRLLAKAYKHAKPNHYIFFEVQGEDGSTSGDTFISGGDIHWRLKTIQGVDHTRKKWARVETTWRLVPGKSQHLHTKQILFEKTMANWLVADLNPPASAMRKSKGKNVSRSKTKRPQERPHETAPPSAPSKQRELEEKLQILQNLKEKGLIDDSEYERRRDALLDSYL